MYLFFIGEGEKQRGFPPKSVFMMWRSLISVAPSLNEVGLLWDWDWDVNVHRGTGSFGHGSKKKITSFLYG
jgi:hypothetical protein